MSELSIALHAVELSAIAWLAARALRKQRATVEFNPGFSADGLAKRMHAALESAMSRRGAERCRAGRPTPETAVET